ncbi:MAG: holo-ACP synthase [Selenomonadaceae bacterium]|nr:holo-ACP synthase [Selenomonadaceae bacterium]
MIGIGTDIIEISRIRRAVAKEHFKRRVFTDTEINYCESRGKSFAASYAARFAAKEAFFKALGTGIITLLEVEVVNNSRGQPEIFLYGETKTLAQEKGVDKIFLSLSHSSEYATAVVAIEERKYNNDR